MRSRSVKLYSRVNRDEMHCEAWEHATSSKAQVVLIKKDPVTGALISRSRGATSTHPSWDEALRAMYDAVDVAEKQGWVKKARGRWGRRGPQPQTPPPRPHAPPPHTSNPFVWCGHCGSIFHPTMSCPSIRPAPPLPTCHVCGGRIYLGDATGQTPEGKTVHKRCMPVEKANPWAGAKFPDVDSAARAMLDAGFKALARTHHPDVGGDVTTMSLLSETRKQIREMLDLVKP